ncbi:MAG: SET domain-containing protein-lysine N-methyltransferase [Gemmatimonadetes bacterium]|nr:SET domain-containing protein-lysine N-methyltransferase [Gemmatimonadota bacterium]
MIRGSTIQGVGVFSVTPIPAGMVIWEYTTGVDWTVTPQEMASFPEPFQASLRRYSYLAESGNYVLCGDNAKFMNHSDKPNCDDRGSHTIAAWDIGAGEELTCDYRSFDVEFDGSEFVAEVAVMR